LSVFRYRWSNCWTTGVVIYFKRLYLLKTNTMKFFFITTSHLDDRIWFIDDDDFKVAMNYVPIASVVAGVTILAFILMSNHVHFLVESTREGAELFINHFKKIYGMHYERKYSVKEFLRRNTVEIQELFTANEALEKCIAYIIMNPVAANICAFPSDYLWGSGNAFFNPSPIKGIRISSLSGRKRRSLLHSKTNVSSGMFIGEDGYIHPRSYVAVKFVESLFRTPLRMNFFLNNSSKAKRRLDNDAFPSFRDQSIIASSQDLCRSLFRKSSQNELTPDELVEYLKQLKRRFSADVNQLARVTGISRVEVSQLLEGLQV